MRRQLRFFDILCIGINGVVGSGIFLLPGKLLGGLGPASIALFGLCGFLLIAVGMCYAEASSRVERNGGVYNYVEQAFGKKTGFAVGWLGVVTMVFGYSAVVAGLIGWLGSLVPWIGAHYYLSCALVITFFAMINIRGVMLGANTTNLLTIGKLIPLGIFIVMGIPYIDLANFVPFAPQGWGNTPSLLLICVFAYQGFEMAPVPAGEMVDAKRVAPRATILTLLLCTLLYIIIQSVIVGSGADIANSDTPLADVALHMFGPWGATLITIGALISMSGYCSGSAFLTPRFLTILCEDGFLPAIGAKYHDRFQTPHVAIIVTSLIVLFMNLFLDFDRLVDISAFAMMLQFICTCIAVPFLRKKMPDGAKTYRAPGGLFFPIAGVIVSLLFITEISFSNFMWSMITIAVGILFSVLYLAITKRAIPK